MSKKIELEIESIVSPIIIDLGYEYVGTEIRRVGEEIELIVYADKDGKLTLHDCENISRARELSDHLPVLLNFSID